MFSFSIANTVVKDMEEMIMGYRHDCNGCRLGYLYMSSPDVDLKYSDAAILPYADPGFSGMGDEILTFMSSK